MRRATSAPIPLDAPVMTMTGLVITGASRDDQDGFGHGFAFVLAMLFARSTLPECNTWNGLSRLPSNLAGGICERFR
jgi:hypothetical protein